MANVKITIPLAGATATIPGAISDNYIIEDSGTMLANYVLTATTPVLSNRVIKVYYKGGLDVTTNNTNIFLFGHDITQEKLNHQGIFTFSWNGATWDMIYVPDFEENFVVSPSKLTYPLKFRTITQIINYDAAISPALYYIINPYGNSMLYEVVIKEIDFIDANAELTIFKTPGNLDPVIYGLGTNGITFSGGGVITVPGPGALSPSFYGYVNSNSPIYTSGDPDWYISIGGLATTGRLEVTMRFELKD